jgi:hypothetical protein
VTHYLDALLNAAFALLSLAYVRWATQSSPARVRGERKKGAGVISRYLPHLLIGALCATLVLVLVRAPKAAPVRRGYCPVIRTEISQARRVVWRLQHEYGLGRTRASRQPILGCAYAGWVRDLWRARGERVAYHYDWRSWLPRNWYLVGSCETGYGGPPNWHHANGSYVSAFGISRRIYDSDAAYMGAPPWSDRHPPTPRQQYLAALGHYKRFGDGWGCPGP